MVKQEDQWEGTRGKNRGKVVSHCDPTVNLFDVLFMTRGDIVMDMWPVDMRGKCL
jgi:hypothetical protein